MNRIPETPLDIEQLSNISSTLKKTSFGIRLNIYLKFAFYLGAFVLCVIIYMMLFHKSRLRWFAPSIMININKYNLEFTTKVTSLIINYQKLTENQFKWSSRLNEGDIYLNLLNDDVAILFSNIKTTLEEKEYILDSKDVYMSSRISKYLLKKFEQFKRYKNHDMERVDLIYNRIGNLVEMKNNFVDYVNSRYIMNYLDTTNLHHTKVLENKIFNKYLIFMSESLRDRYYRIKRFHPTSVVSEYFDELIKETSNEWFFNSKDSDPVAYCSRIFADIQDTIKSILIENTKLTMNELNDKEDESMKTEMNIVDAEEHNNLLETVHTVLDDGSRLISIEDYERLKSTYYIDLEKFMYKTYVTKDNIQTNVFSEFDTNTILSKFRNILDILLLIENRKTIEMTMDFTIHYMLDPDSSKTEKLNTYSQFYLQLFEYIAYHENNYERILRYNRSRWPVLPQLQKSYTRQFVSAYKIFIVENIAEQWTKFGKSQPTTVEPILQAIDNSINPQIILRSLL